MLVKMVKATIRWQRVAVSDELRRSSQSIGIASGHLGIFGGELKPREPVDNKVYTVPLTGDGTTSSLTSSLTTPRTNPTHPAKHYSIEAGASGPPPRVGHASTTLAGTTYTFSGRGGVALSPLDEKGGLWAYSNARWTFIEPADPAAPVPPPRSYHAMTTDGRDAVYVHAGCEAEGRLGDLWVFVVSSRRWARLADAPGRGRGGTSVAFCAGEEKMYRMGGFDGKAEIGGAVDVYDPVNDYWTSRTFEADGVEGPGARSVGCLVALTSGEKNWLVTAFGESDPSSLGHAGAGKMLEDAWAYDIKEDKWIKIEQLGDGIPQPRGWFAAEPLGTNGIVVQGGLAEDNSRLGDVRVGTFDVQ